MIDILQIRDVKKPERGFKTSSWLDFFIPNDLTEVKMTPFIWTREKFNEFNEKWELVIWPWEWAMIPSWLGLL